MRTAFLLVILAFITAAGVLPMTGQAADRPAVFTAEQAVQAGPPIVGIWRLNREKSHLPPTPAGWFDIRQYSLRPDGYLVGLLVTSNARGYHYLQFTAKSDGKDYPEYTDDLLADVIAMGRSTIRTYSETIIDEDVTAWTDKVNGKVTASGRKIVSKDRQTLTITVEGRPQPYVYDRQ